MDGSRRQVLKGVGSLAAAGVMPGAGAQDAPWPNRAMTYIIPFTPGGITDQSGRLLAKLLSPRLGQSVVVENRPGAGGSVGVEYGARRPPDGYTMIYGTSGTHAANLALYKNLKYDPIKDFEAVIGMSVTPLLLVINPNRPYGTVPELIAYAKANPGKLNFATSGAGTGVHLTAEVFQMATGTKMMHVPYKGSAPALTDLVAGQVDLMFDYASVVLPMVQSGKLKALATTARKRLEVFPNVPTVAELGFPNAESSAWSGVFMPAKTPPDIVRRLGDLCAEAMAEPEFRQLIARSGGVPLELREAKLAAFVKSEFDRWSEVIRVSGAKLD